MENMNEVYSKTEKEYRKIDKLTAKYRELAEIMKTLQYGSEEFNKLFAEYRETFKKVNGYFPHWAR